jgi:hypothetical protein
VRPLHGGADRPEGKMAVGRHLVGVVASSWVGKERGVRVVPAVATVRLKVADHQRDPRWRKNAATLSSLGDGGMAREQGPGLGVGANYGGWLNDDGQCGWVEWSWSGRVAGACVSAEVRKQMRTSPQHCPRMG